MRRPITLPPSTETVLVRGPLVVSLKRPLSRFSRGCPWTCVTPRPPAPLIPLLGSRELCVHAGGFLAESGCLAVRRLPCGRLVLGLPSQSEGSVLRSACVGDRGALAPPLATPASSRPSRLRKRPGPAASEQSPGPLPAAATVHKLPLPCFRVRSTFPFARRKPKLGHLHPVPRKSEEGRPRGPGAEA